MMKLRTRTLTSRRVRTTYTLGRWGESGWAGRAQEDEGHGNGCARSCSHWLFIGFVGASGKAARGAVHWELLGLWLSSTKSTGCASMECRVRNDLVTCSVKMGIEGEG